MARYYRNNYKRNYRNNYGSSFKRSYGRSYGRRNNSPLSIFGAILLLIILTAGTKIGNILICITIAIGGYLVYKKFFAKKRINETESKTTNLNVNNETNNNIQEPIADSKTQGYETSKSIVTETEKMFYKRLVIYCSPKMYTVNMKTRLEDLVEYSKGMSFAEKQKYRGQIKSRHVDFLIVDSELKPVFAIELDDNSHLKQKAMETDKFKDELFQKIGIPLYRIPADESIWNIELDRIFEKIGNTQN